MTARGPGNPDLSAGIRYPSLSLWRGSPEERRRYMDDSERYDEEFVCLEAGGRKTYMLRGAYEKMKERTSHNKGSFMVGLGDKILHPSDARSVSLQLGVPVETWGDVKRALAATNSRIVEPGDPVHQQLREVDEMYAGPQARREEANRKNPELRKVVHPEVTD